MDENKTLETVEETVEAATTAVESIGAAATAVEEAAKKVPEVVKNTPNNLKEHGIAVLIGTGLGVGTILVARPFCHVIVKGAKWTGQKVKGFFTKAPAAAETAKGSAPAEGNSAPQNQPDQQK